MRRKLLYTNQGRSGYVVYQDDKPDIHFYFEFGGGDCVAIINIPTDEEWMQITGRKHEEREEIIHFIAEQATREQTFQGHYLIKNDCIEIYSGKVST